MPQFDLSLLADDFGVTIFVGSCRKTLPFELAQEAQRRANRLEWLKVDGMGNNALDFHIAYYLGCLFTQSPQMQCFILSRDSGFDPLMRHLKRRGFYCRRINDLAEVDAQTCADVKPICKPMLVCKSNRKPEGTSRPKSQPAATAAANYLRVVQNLTKIAQGLRPATRKSLTRHVNSITQKKLTEPEIQRLVNLLFTEGKVVETDESLIYDL